MTATQTRVGALVERCSEVYATVVDAGYGATDALEAELTGCNVAELKAIATGFGLRILSNWGKSRLVAEIVRKPVELLQSTIRISAI